MDEKISKIAELLEDESIRAQIENAERAEDVVKLFAANGVEVSAEEINAALEAQFGESELNEEALENVAGGMKFPFGRPFPRPRHWPWVLI